MADAAYHLNLSNGSTAVPAGEVEATGRFFRGNWSSATKKSVIQRPRPACMPRGKRQDRRIDFRPANNPGGNSGWAHEEIRNTPGEREAAQGRGLDALSRKAHQPGTDSELDRGIPPHRGFASCQTARVGIISGRFAGPKDFRGSAGGPVSRACGGDVLLPVGGLSTHPGTGGQVDRRLCGGEDRSGSQPGASLGPPFLHEGG